MKKYSILVILTTTALALSLTIVVPKANANLRNQTISDADNAAETYGNPYGYAKKPTVGTRVKCPVLVGSFNVKDDTPFSKYKGKYYAFCCKDCKSKFDADPEKYLSACPEDCPCED